jgi:hypothetical protein
MMAQDVQDIIKLARAAERRRTLIFAIDAACIALADQPDKLQELADTLFRFDTEYKEKLDAEHKL